MLQKKIKDLSRLAPEAFDGLLNTKDSEGFKTLPSGHLGSGEIIAELGKEPSRKSVEDDMPKLSESKESSPLDQDSDAEFPSVVKDSEELGRNDPVLDKNRELVGAFTTDNGASKFLTSVSTM